MSSELLALRKRVLLLQQKATQAQRLETQNAMLHLTVARLEQENITLKDAVVILQRKLSEHEAQTLQHATRLSECQRQDLASRSSRQHYSTNCTITSVGGSGSGSQERNSLSNSNATSVSVGCTSTTSTNNGSPTLRSFHHHRQHQLSPPQIRRTSTSPSPPPLMSSSRYGRSGDDVVVVTRRVSPVRSTQHGDAFSQQQQQPSVSSPHAVAPPPPSVQSLLFTPPRRVAATLSPYSPQRSLMNQLSDIEVSAISSLFSPMSAYNGGGGQSTTPIAPRTSIPSPTPRGLLVVNHRNNTSNDASSVRSSLSHSTYTATTLAATPMPSLRASSGSVSPLQRGNRRSPTPISPSREALRMVHEQQQQQRPPRVPSPPLSTARAAMNRRFSSTSRQQQQQQRSSSTSPLCSRSSSVASSSMSLSIDEELNEGIQKRLASLMFC